MRPVSWATTTARARLLSCSLLIRRSTWVVTVASLSTSRCAIRALEGPLPTRRRTSVSRGVSSARCGFAAAAVRWCREKVSISRWVMRGAIGMSPPPRDRVHRGDDAVGRGVLQQEARGTLAERRVDVLVEVERGQHDHARR